MSFGHAAVRGDVNADVVADAAGNRRPPPLPWCWADVACELHVGRLSPGWKRHLHRLTGGDRWPGGLVCAREDRDAFERSGARWRVEGQADPDGVLAAAARQQAQTQHRGGQPVACGHGAALRVSRPAVIKMVSTSSLGEMWEGTRE